MTFSQLTSLKHANPDTEWNIDNSIAYGTQSFKEGIPYVINDGIDGNNVILFDTHFTTCVLQAMTEDTLARMSPFERTVWHDYVDYENNPVSTGQRETTDEILAALNTWIMKTFTCNTTFATGDGFDNYTSTNKCSNN